MLQRKINVAACRIEMKIKIKFLLYYKNQRCIRTAIKDSIENQRFALQIKIKAAKLKKISITDQHSYLLRNKTTAN